jgi:hypothetical protein
MKKLRLSQLSDEREGHFLKGFLPGDYLAWGGLRYRKPGKRTHTNDGPGGRDRHVHEDTQVFIILQGKATMELNGQVYPLVTGDVFIVEAGEDHHLIPDEDDPCVDLWLHSSAERHTGGLGEPPASGSSS